MKRRNAKEMEKITIHPTYGSRIKKVSYLSRTLSRNGCFVI